jgi:hypothetical protein
VIPLSAGGKKPLVKWAEFQTTKPDWAQIEQWQVEYMPDWLSQLLAADAEGSSPSSATSQGIDNAWAIKALEDEAGSTPKRASARS